MARVLDLELTELNNEVMKMAEVAESAMDKSVKSFLDLDLELAAEAEAADPQLYNMSMSIEQKCFELIARYQPLAKDLRAISAYLAVIRSLYRIGRYSMDIAIQTNRMKGMKHYKKLVTIPEMARITRQMVLDSLKALVNRDVTLVENLHNEDDKVDAYFEEVLRESMTYVMQDGKLIPQTISYILVSRFLERIGDHACYIGESVLYTVTGERRMIR